MKSLSLITDLKQLKEIDEFLNKELLISTDTTEDDIDKIYDLCIDETFAYSVYTNYFMNTDKYLYDKSKNEYTIPRDIKLDDIIKKNCIMATLYTLLFLKENENFIDLNEFLKSKVELPIIKETREKINYLFDAVLRNRYLSRFSILKKVDQKKMIGSFNKDFTWHIILNQQNQSDTVIGENVKFSIDKFLQSISCESGNKNLEPKDIYKRHRSTRNGIKNILHGLSMVRDDWKCEDQSNQLIFEYTKELVFHHNIILLFVNEMNKVLNENNKKYEYVLDLINDWHQVLKSPLLYDLNENMVNSLEMMYDVGYLFNKYSYPILVNTFFITLIKKNKYNIQKIIEDLERYIKGKYDTDLTSNHTVFSSDAIFDEVIRKLDATSLHRLSAVIIDIYTPTEPFKIDRSFKRPDHLNTKSEKKSIAIQYEYICNK